MADLGEHRVVLNIVWTPGVFTYLRHFVASQLRHCAARVRFVTNACGPGEIVEMEAFGDTHPDRVVEILDISSKEMVPHGRALDAVVRRRDDGDAFCFIDSDIKARGRFLQDLLAHLGDAGAAAVTSGRGIWTDETVVPADHPGISGEHFFAPDGYCFGSPHLGLYRREPLLATMDRWGVGFGSGGRTLPDMTVRRLVDAGRAYFLYDTGKVVNILLQEDGYRLRHEEHPALLHVGGVSHYLSAPDSMLPSWAQTGRGGPRFEVAGFTAHVLRALCDGAPPPEVPAEIDPDLQDRLAFVREELIDLVTPRAASRNAGDAASGPDTGPITR